MLDTQGNLFFVVRYAIVHFFLFIYYFVDFIDAVKSSLISF